MYEAILNRRQSNIFRSGVVEASKICSKVDETDPKYFKWATGPKVLNMR